MGSTVQNYMDWEVEELHSLSCWVGGWMISVHCCGG